MTTLRQGTVNTAGLRLRSGPGTQFGIIMQLGKDTLLDIVEQQDDWLKVRVGGREGFVAAQFVDIKAQADLSGYLKDRPALFDIELVPDRQIPTDNLSGAELAVARTWNSYGNFLSQLAQLLSAPVSAVIAVLVAESSGRVFASDGRMIIRFENHIFYRRWGVNNEDVFFRFFKFDTSSPRNNWKSHQWRPNVESAWQNFHGNQKLEWDVLAFARALDDTAALSSISMGAPQVMGFNYKVVGYESVQAMFDAFARSAQSQLLAMFDVVKGPNASSPGLIALQNRDYLTFASIYNGPANAPTYRDIIQVRADMFDRLIKLAVPTPRPDVSRGPVDVPATPTPTPVDATPPPPPPPVITTPPVTPPPPPVNEGPILIATTAGLNVRSEPQVREGNVIERLRQNEPITLLEPVADALKKMDAGEKGKQFIKVRTDEGREGYVAAWLVAPGEALVKQTVDAYIDSIPDGDYPMPAGYDAFWAMRDTVGLPDPFSSLPVLIRTQHKLVNMMVNGFGPNTFASRNWQKWYSRIGGMHNGHDFIVETGTPLLAVTDGVIIRNWPFMGNPRDKSIVLWCFLPERYRDGRGRRMMSNVLVAYGHMSNNDIKQDLDVVKAGEIIGYSGTPAGSLDNDHLHLEVHLLGGDTKFMNLRKLPPRKLLKHFDRPQPFSNQAPWNTLLFYSRRLAKYQLHQGKVIGYFGRTSYPTVEMLRAMGATHLPPLNEFTLAYFEYGIPVVWQNSGRTWPDGVVTTDMLPERLRAFTKFEPYEASFLK